MNKIVLIDDDDFILKMIKKILLKNNIEVITYKYPSEEFYDSIKITNNINAIITDLKLTHSNGIDVIKKIKSLNNDIPIILITGFGDMQTVIDAFRAGAYDFITKPIERDYLFLSVNRAIEKHLLRTENIELLKNIENSKETISKLETSLNVFRNVGNNQYGIVGQSTATKNILKLIEIACNCDSNILITGETGTGKDIVANAIHHNSQRNKKPISIINCGAIPDNLLESELFGFEKGAFTGAIKSKIGILEYAHGGTVVLDEIGDLPKHVQVKLLRAIQEKKIRRLGSNKEIDIDIRIIAATNRDLSQMVIENNFREDLYFRLNVIPIHIPPLRERREDIIPLINHFIEHYCRINNKKQIIFSEDSFHNIFFNEWKGNIRELQNFVERIVVTSVNGSISVDSLYKLDSDNILHEDILLKDFLIQQERRFLINRLKKNNWNFKNTAKELGISFKTLYNKLKKLSIKLPAIK